MSYPNSNVSYPTTYADVRSTTYGAYNSAAAVGAPVQQGYTAGYNPFPSFDSTGTGATDTTRGRGRGGNRGRGRGKRLPGAPKVFSCANKHPCNALKCLRPDATFNMICSYATSKGSALVYTTVVDGVTYQGEGTSGSIAKAIAASKALAGINAFQHELIQVVGDYEEQKKLVMERIETWQEAQTKKEKQKEDTARRVAENAAREALKQANKKKKENNGDSTPMDTTEDSNNDDSGNLNKPTLLDYGRLVLKYGPDVNFDINETPERNEIGSPIFSCNLKVQGFSFTGNGSSKKNAKSDAVSRAFELFAVSPPPVVNLIADKKRKIPKKAVHEFKPMEPVEFQDKLAEICWNFVSDKIAEIPAHLARRRNLVTMVKVEGDDDLEKCEVVSFGNGTYVIKRENIGDDGNAINDSTGETLATKAFRKYLLDQLAMALNNDKASIYQKDRGGKCSLKKGIKFYMYSNSTPIGDCRAKFIEPVEVKPEETMEGVENVPVVKQEPEIKVEMSGVEEKPTEGGQDEQKPPVRGRGRFKRYFKPRPSTAIEDLGKIQVYGCKEDEPTEYTILEIDPEKEHQKNLVKHIIVSPSDKLATRQITGLQGSVLSLLSNPIYISKYLINRSYDEESLQRALYDRVKDAKPNYAASLVSPVPAFLKVEWRATRSTENRTPFAFVWAVGHEVEVIFSPNGKKIDYAVADTKDREKLAAESLPSEYSTRALYNSFTAVCAKLKKPVQKYAAIKQQSDKYRTVKNGVRAHLQKTGLGTWPSKDVKPSF